MQIGQAAVGSMADQICRDRSRILQEASGIPLSELSLILDKTAASTSGAAVFGFMRPEQPDTRHCSRWFDSR